MLIIRTTPFNMASANLKIVNMKELKKTFDGYFHAFTKKQNGDYLFIHNATEQWSCGKMWELVSELRKFEKAGCAIIKGNKRKIKINDEMYFMLVVSCHEAKGTDAEFVNLMALALGFNISSFVYLMKYGTFKLWKKHLYDAIAVFEKE